MSRTTRNRPRRVVAWAYFLNGVRTEYLAKKYITKEMRENPDLRIPVNVTTWYFSPEELGDKITPRDTYQCQNQYYIRETKRPRNPGRGECSKRQLIRKNRAAMKKQLVEELYHLQPEDYNPVVYPQILSI